MAAVITALHRTLATNNNNNNNKIVMPLTPSDSPTDRSPIIYTSSTCLVPSINCPPNPIINQLYANVTDEQNAPNASASGLGSDFEAQARTDHSFEAISSICGTQGDSPAPKTSINLSMLSSTDPNVNILDKKFIWHLNTATRVMDTTHVSTSATCAQTRRQNVPVLRPVIIDGSNVAMSHGIKKVFSCRGIAICVDWFKARGHKDVIAIVPKWRTEPTSKNDVPVQDSHILVQLENDKNLVYTPSRKLFTIDDQESSPSVKSLLGQKDTMPNSGATINTLNTGLPKYKAKRIVCYDDRYILKLALTNGGIIVSNDNYRDLALESVEYAKLIETRILMYTFINDSFMPPDDPLGRFGPNLNEFLQVNFGASSPKTSDGSSFSDLNSPRTSFAQTHIPIHLCKDDLPVCPYGPKCTYGNKCKFYHPEKDDRSGLRSIVTEQRIELAHREMQKYLAKERSGKKALCRTFSLQPNHLTLQQQLSTTIGSTQCNNPLSHYYKESSTFGHNKSNGIITNVNPLMLATSISTGASQFIYHGLRNRQKSTSLKFHPQRAKSPKPWNSQLAYTLSKLGTCNVIAHGLSNTFGTGVFNNEQYGAQSMTNAEFSSMFCNNQFSPSNPGSLAQMLPHQLSPSLTTLIPATEKFPQNYASQHRTLLNKNASNFLNDINCPYTTSKDFRANNNASIDPNYSKDSLFAKRLIGKCISDPLAMISAALSVKDKENLLVSSHAPTSELSDHFTSKIWSNHHTSDTNYKNSLSNSLINDLAEGMNLNGDIHLTDSQQISAPNGDNFASSVRSSHFLQDKKSVNQLYQSGIVSTPDCLIQQPIPSLPCDILNFLDNVSYESPRTTSNRSNLLQSSLSSHIPQPIGNHLNTDVDNQLKPSLVSQADKIRGVEPLIDKNGLYFHLASLFPEGHVRLVMKMHPDVTDVKVLCALLIKM